MPFFLPYQRRWIEDPAPIKLMEKSRQIGMSWATAYALVSRTATPDQRLDAWVSSRDELQARLFLEDCQAFARLLNLASADFGQPVLPDAARPSSTSLRLANGRSIHSLSSNPDAQAGKRGTRVLDEFALHPDPARLYRIAWPGVTWGGRLEIISTHRGRHNFFNTLVEEITQRGNPKNISHHRVTLVDALDQGFLEKLQAKLPPDDPRKSLSRDDYLQFVRSRCPDEESWLQEYLCQPADESSAFLPYATVAACESPNPLLTSPADLPRHPSARYYLGLDLARSRDLTVFWLLEATEDLLITRLLLTCENQPFSQQEALLDQFLALPAVRRVCIDATGLGRQFAERAQERYGAHRVEGLTLTAPLKEALAYPLRTALEDRRLRLPADDTLRADLRSVRRELTAAGHYRFAAERTPDGHADRFWALALAIHAATPPPSHARPTFYESITIPRPKG